MTTQEERKIRSAEKFKKQAKDLALQIIPIFEQDSSKQAVLLCEGNSNSMDFFIYSILYPEFIVTPVGGCTNITRLTIPMRKLLNKGVYGLIDRDNCSKKEIRDLKNEEGIYCTKLPFIENILCCPDLLKIICKEANKDYNQVISYVRSSFANILAKKMSLLNPFNVGLPKDSEVQMISISIVTKNNIVHKKIDLSNVMYTFRNKSIVGLVAYAMDFHGADAYYRFLRTQIEGSDREQILQVISKYLPTIRILDY